MNDSTNGNGTKEKFLPMSAVNSELIDTIMKQMEADDESRQQPEWWDIWARAVAESDEKVSLFGSAFEACEKNGYRRMVPGLILKGMALGWKMADLYLSRNFERGSDGKGHSGN